MVLAVSAWFLVLAGGAVAQSVFPSPSDWRDQNIYFIFTDRFFDGDPSNNNANPQLAYAPSNSRRHHGGDFKGIEKKLDYIKALGATAIWITPIPQNVGSSGYHGYGADDFYKLQPNWGTTNDLKSLVAAAHARGIYVVLDVVINHAGDRIDSANSSWNTTFNSNGYAPRWRTGQAYPPPFNQLTNFHNNGIINNYTDPEQMLGEVSGLDDLRTETPYVRTNLVAIYKHWMDVADFDGFRLDTVKHVDIGAWQYFNMQIRNHANAIGKTNFFQFGEIFDGSDDKVGYYTGTKAGGSFAMDSVLDYPLFYRANSVFAVGTGNTKQLEDHYNIIPSKYDAAAKDRLITFLDNHDGARFMSAANNDTNKLQLALSWLYTSLGIPCLYYGTEQHFNGSNDPNNREDMFAGRFGGGPAALGDNFNMTQSGFLHIARLNNLRRLYPSLRRGAHLNRANNSGGPGIFAYARRLGGEEVFVVFNSAASSQTLPARPSFYSQGTVLVNLMNTNEKVVVTAGSDGFPSMSIASRQLKAFLPESLLLPLDPVVLSQAPRHDASNVSATAAITLTFSKPMDTNAAQAAFSLHPSTSGSFAWSPDRTAMTFTPTVSFPGNTLMELHIGTNAFDTQSSNHLYGAFQTRFTTSNSGFSDTTPPDITIQSPTNGAWANGIITISGTATDNVAVVRVEVQVDNSGWVAAGGTTSWTHSVDSQNLLNGTHQIEARAIDSSSNLSAAAYISVRVFNPPAPVEHRINAGGTLLTDCVQRVWQADREWQVGSFGFLNGSVGYMTNTILNVCPAEQELYRTERYGQTLDYRFDVPEGVYEITLLNAETYNSGTNQRVFDLFIEDIHVLTNFDIFAEAGGKNIPITLAFTNDVADGQLDLHFTYTKDSGRASAIQVKKVAELDSDGDGVPNWWLRAWFDHPTGLIGDHSRADDDADGDGFNTLEEFIALTSPIDPDSYPRIQRIESEQGTAVIMPSAEGRLYDLQWTAELSDTNPWITILNNQPGTGAALPMIDSNESTHGTYRVRVHVP